MSILREPESMNELVYFTQRGVGKGNVKAWARKSLCPKCKKGTMSKPVDEKTGKVKIRAKEYLCPECGYMIEKIAYEETLECEVIYTCPECNNSGEASVPFKWRTFQGMKSVLFQCDKCKAKIPITKKMKEKSNKN
ncbi:hypothetical protein HQ545_00985 [Candidatus Woesearchaeota archaeon]|nr:hypothetical protein [Candidatus Woesearchaeota archaeon]